MKATKAELIISEDGTLYHLDLKRADSIPRNLLLMGSAERVGAVAEYFDTVTFRHSNPARPEFQVAFGTYKGVPVGALSTGIGTPSVEIVCNELHALFEYDQNLDVWEKPTSPVNIIRVGTCGTSFPDIPLGALVISEYSIGLDNAGLYYLPAEVPRSRTKAGQLLQAFKKTKLGKINPCLYVAPVTKEVAELLKKKAQELKIDSVFSGLTTSSPGFFAAEGRTIGRMRTALSLQEFIKEINDFSFEGTRIVNHEMETSILFRIMNEVLGYRVGAVCLVLDNLVSNEVIDPTTYKTRMDLCIKLALETLLGLVKT